MSKVKKEKEKNTINYNQIKLLNILKIPTIYTVNVQIEKINNVHLHTYIQYKYMQFCSFFVQLKCFEYNKLTQIQIQIQQQQKTKYAFK